MVAVCPLRDGPDVSRCGCGPRGCSSKGSIRCRWPEGCGSVRNRPTSGGGDGGPAVRRRCCRKGQAGSACRLNPAQLDRLAAALDEGLSAYGWEQDRRWTLGRITTLIGRMFHVRYTLRGTSYLLHRLGFAPQVPAHRAAERDATDLAAGKKLAAASGAWICFADEAG
jgi:hypothetical protein